MTTLTGGTVLALLAAGVLAIVLAFTVPAPLNYGIAAGFLLTGYLIITSQKRKEPLMTTITLPADAARYLAEVALSAASVADVTPVMAAGLFIATPTEVRVVATDRYRAHTAVAEPINKPSPGEFLLGRSTLQWIQKNAFTFKRRGMSIMKPTVTIRTSTAPDDFGVTITVTEHEGDNARTLVLRDEQVRGKFPPVMKLIEEARAAEEGPSEPILLQFLAKMAALDIAGRRSAPRVKFTKAKEGSKKPGQAIVDFKSGGKIYATALIQPNLRVDTADV